MNVHNGPPAGSHKIKLIKLRSQGIVHRTNNQSQEEFEDTKGVIKIRISKRNRQHNGQRKKYKQHLQNIYMKPKIE